VLVDVMVGVEVGVGVMVGVGVKVQVSEAVGVEVGVRLGGTNWVGDGAKVWVGGPGVKEGSKVKMPGVTVGCRPVTVAMRVEVGPVSEGVFQAKATNPRQ
jgi:hypothetical protein